MPSLAASVAPGKSIEQAVERVQKLEQLGYDSVWCSQLPDARDTPLVLAEYARATTTIKLGTAVMPIYTRHPTAMAQAAATLDELSHGRFLLGLGVAHQITVEGFWGLKLEHPAQAMREYIEIVRTTLRTGGSDVSGEHFTARWQYRYPRNPDLPILVAALGPKMLELAGEVADGVSLWMCAPSYIENVVVPQVRKGRERAGKSMEGFIIEAAVAACLTTDVPAAIEAFRPTAQLYSSLPFYRRALVGAGFTEAELDEGAERVAMNLAGIGDESTIRETIRRYRDAGANLPAIGPFNAPGSAGPDAVFEAAIAT